MEKDDAYRMARKTVAARIGFFIHLGAYVVVNVLLVVINLAFSPQYLWFFWPLLGWGIGVFFHAMGVFVFHSGSKLKEQMVQREAERLMSGQK